MLLLGVKLLIVKSQQDLINLYSINQKIKW
jgi:hypothetical protein